MGDKQLLKSSLDVLHTASAAAAAARGVCWSPEGTCQNWTSSRGTTEWAAALPVHTNRTGARMLVGKELQRPEEAAGAAAHWELRGPDWGSRRSSSKVQPLARDVAPLSAARLTLNTLCLIDLNVSSFVCGLFHFGFFVFFFFPLLSLY